MSWEENLNKTDSENTKNEIDFTSDNIFDEFSTESQQASAEIQQEKQKKDVYFYFQLLSKFFVVANICLLLIVITLWAYTYIQSRDTQEGYSFLTPICGVFLGDVASEYSSCYGINTVLQEKQESLESLKATQTQTILGTLWDIYDIKNFNLSKKMLFLLEKSENRLGPLEILSAFDTLKNKFAPVDKSEITCYDIEIYTWNVLSITCDAYSSDWDSSIIDLKDGLIETVPGWGTSISRASSFVNFLTSYPGSDFSIVEKPEDFTAVEVQEWPYTHKTTIQIRLRYIGDYNQKI